MILNSCAACESPNSKSRQGSNHLVAIREKMILIWFLLYFVYASEFTTEFTSERFMNAEARIIDKILANYNTEVRPSVNGTGQPIEVTSFTKIKTQTFCFCRYFQ